MFTSRNFADNYATCYHAVVEKLQFEYSKIILICEIFVRIGHLRVEVEIVFITSIRL